VAWNVLCILLSKHSGRGGDCEVKEYGERPDENQTDIDNPMLFRLDPGVKQKIKKATGKDDTPMWSSLLSVEMDGFYGQE